MRIRQCCKVCVVIQLITFSVLLDGSIVIWGAIELSEQGWDPSSIYVKFSCIGAGFLLINIVMSGIFYCVVWRRAIRRENRHRSIEMAVPKKSVNVERPVPLYTSAQDMSNLWGSEESTSESVTLSSPKSEKIKSTVTSSNAKNKDIRGAAI